MIRKTTVIMILAAFALAAAAGLAHAATEFTSTISASGGDYTTLALWQAANQSDLTTSVVLSHGAITGTLAGGEL